MSIADFRRVAAFVAAAAGAAAQCPPASVDGDFFGWTGMVLSSVPATNAWSSGPSGSGGNPGGCLQVTQSVTGGVVGAGIFLAHLEPTPRPLPPGGLGRVDLAYQARLASESPVGAFGSVVGVLCCLEQDGVVYYAPTSYTLIYLNAGWGPRAATGLVQNGFEAPPLVPGGPIRHPDFAAGSPVRFGIATSNGNSGGGSFGGGDVASTTSLYDDFAVTLAPAASIATVVPGCGVPAPPILTASTPVMGSTVTITLTGAAPGAASALVWGAPVSPFALGACQTAMDLKTLFVFASFVTDATGGWSTSFPVPVVCALAGLPIAQQVFTFDPASPFGFTLSNGLLARLGV